MGVVLLSCRIKVFKDEISWETGYRWKYNIKMGFEILTEVKMSMVVLWVMAPSGPVDGYEGFGGTYCLHLEGYKKYNV
jgi:hypothetical protein